ncbi:MAG: hypothetical protein JSU63_22125 [Phycisphaerales bacterium]|nr:MAG: hypothetical protein JSU63_22125 [Phycisphaerales bacterium]
MTSWTLLLCEGAHDRSALAALACVCGGWERQKGIPKSCPEALQKTYPVLKRDRHDAYLYQSPPAYLFKGDRWLVILALGNDVDVLGDTATHAVRQYNPDAVGVVVDANDVGVDNRVKAFRNRYERIRELPKRIEPGVVIPGRPRVGIWVAPDNKRKGKMDDLLLHAARRTHREVITGGEAFVDSLHKANFEEKSLEKDRSKIVLGAVHQPIRPGASLASGLEASRCWPQKDRSDLPTLKKLLQFIEELTGL